VVRKQGKQTNIKLLIDGKLGMKWKVSNGTTEISGDRVGNLERELPGRGGWGG